MLNKAIFILWILYAGLVGIMVGGSIDSAFFAPAHYGSSERQNTTPKSESLEERQEATNEALASYTQWLMRYTGILAIATLGLGVATIGLYVAGITQLRLATAEFIATQRPRIRVRNVVIEPANKALLSRLGFFQPDQPLKGQFYISNVAGSAASITKSLCMVYWSSSALPMRRPYELGDGNDAAPVVKLAAGESTIGSFESEKSVGKEWGRYVGGRTIGVMHVYVMGWIEYRDDNGIPRRTVFCREYKKGPWDEGRFRQVKNRDYEHEE